MPLIVAAVLIELVVIAHILRSGRERYWIIVVLALSLPGVLIYLLAEVIPPTARIFSSWRARRRRAAFRSVGSDVAAPRISREMDAAEQCLDSGQFQQAQQLYRRCLGGTRAGDPQLLLGLAKAQFGAGEFAATIGTLDELRVANPNFQSNEGHLLYARAHEELGDVASACAEYEALCSYFPGPEAKCRFAALLQNNGERQRAVELYAEVVEHSASAGLHYNTIYRQWIETARRNARAPSS